MESVRSNITVCPNCGNEPDADSKFCKHCGFNLSTSQTIPQVKDAGKRTWIIALIAAGLILGLAVLIAVLSIWRTSSTQYASSASTRSSDDSAQSTLTSTPSRSELTRESVLNLVKGRMTKNVDAAMPTMALYPDTQRWQVYKQMVDANIIVCPSRGYFGDFADCKPGPNGKQLRARNGTLTLPIGRKVPSVTGISKSDQTSALAQIKLTFESSGGYEFFKKYQPAFKANPLFGSGFDMDNEQHTVHLRLYDDGWRIERIE